MTPSGTSPVVTRRHTPTAITEKKIDEIRLSMIDSKTINDQEDVAGCRGVETNLEAHPCRERQGRASDSPQRG